MGGGEKLGLFISCHSKLNLRRKFHPNRIMGKCSKLEMDWPVHVENPRYSLKTPNLRPRNFFSKRNFDTEFEIYFVGTMDIQSYTQSEQPRVVGKHLTRLARNGMVDVTYL